VAVAGTVFQVTQHCCGRGDSGKGARRQSACQQTKVRVDSQHVSKPSRLVGPGNVLTFVQADRTRVVRIVSCGDRRGPASEAQELYEDRSPEIVRRPFNPGGDRKGRPTKKDRRDMIAHRGTDAPFDLD